MKSFTLLAITLLVVGCDREVSSDHPQPIQMEAPGYPEKVVTLLSLIEQLEPGTNVSDWLQKLNRTAEMPEKDVILAGSGDDSRVIWHTFRLKVDDEWALSIKAYHSEIWQAIVVRTSVSKWLANEPCETEEIYPQYYNGHIVGSEEEKLQLTNNNVKQFGTEQPAIRSESDSEGGEKPQPKAEGQSR